MDPSRTTSLFFASAKLSSWSSSRIEAGLKSCFSPIVPKLARLAFVSVLSEEVAFSGKREGRGRHQSPDLTPGPCQTEAQL